MLRVTVVVRKKKTLFHCARGLYWRGKKTKFVELSFVDVFKEMFFVSITHAIAD